MITVPFFRVDTFTKERFRGKPAAVCLFEAAPGSDLMRTLSEELNQPDTAFIVPLDGPASAAQRFSLRWPAASADPPLSSHTALAAAAVVLREFGNSSEALSFEAAGGAKTARPEGESICIDFAVDEARPVNAPSPFLATLGLERVEEAHYSQEGRHLILRLNTQDAVLGLAPDFQKLREAADESAFAGVAVTAPGSDGWDFVYRYFAPWQEVAEDPVTPAAQAALAPYWGKRLKKTALRAYQNSRRGGSLTLRVHDGRVDVVGEAVVVADGSIRLG